jgi:ADP-ribose pyrophosphatase YjhB (NUDIX family)
MHVDEHYRHREQRTYPYMPPIITCSVALERDGNLLLIQEATPIIYGKWNQPAGHLESGESLFDCAIREACEESGYHVELTGLQAIYTDISASRQRLNFCFCARPLGDPGPIDQTEILSTRWFTPDELKQLPDDQLRHVLARQRIDDWLAGKRTPLDILTPITWGI